MDFTCEISKLYSVSPFEVLKQDKDAVIMLINYFIEKGQGNAGHKAAATVTEKEQDRAFWSAL